MAEEERSDSSHEPSPTTRLVQGGPLRLINTHTLELEEFKQDSPPYAILSHTWGDEEVSFDDWQKGGREDRDGYAKIIGTCRQAKQDGLDYIWCDTCCIDKKNNAETSEAINSMYQWYRLAGVCYVCLSDVQRDATQYGSSSQDGEGLTTSELKSFRKARYFRRGWTLQELLAPHNVQFFDSKWQSLGSLDGPLAQAISNATGIDIALLQHKKALSDFSIPQRLSWASARRTTKIEDRAYSLLGILGVNLDMRYGEGKQAFVRLQKEILKLPHGLTVLAWMSTDESREMQLLADSPDDFAESDNIILDQSMSVPKIWETNIGLTGDLPLMEPEQHEDGYQQVMVSLGCCFDGSPQKSLALLISKSVTNFATDPDLVYTVRALAHPDRTTNKFIRLAEIEFFDYAKVIWREGVTLLWKGDPRRSVMPLDRVLNQHREKLSTALR